ncbi:MAG: DUF3857 domain-containing protein [Bacteroidales bacterium]|nr:DUF3857 domain-containing protein [Candidatus Latescibacterota bacterium]
MIRIRCIYSVSIVIMILSLSASLLSAASMGSSNGHDLDALLARAAETCDFSEEDAIILLASRTVSIRDDGTMKTRVHSVVWIGTGTAIHEYADLRIPWNSSCSSLDVIRLRTWREGMWYPSESEVSATAVVETLPFAVARADDYTAMRETMLLHDGIEVPCVIETVYEITETEGAPGGADGVWIFHRDDRAVMVEFVLEAPAGDVPRFVTGNSAPVPVKSDLSEGRVRFVSSMEDVPRLGVPHIVHPEGHAPFLFWSTWKDWQSMADRTASTFENFLTLSVDIRERLHERLVNELDDASKAIRIAAVIDERVRLVRCDPRLRKFEPRPAGRTWETGYGHVIDRGVLATALFRAAGMKAQPEYISTVFNRYVLELPGLSIFDRRLIHIQSGTEGGCLDAWYNPGTGELIRNRYSTGIRMSWQPCSGSDLPIKTEYSEFSSGNSFDLTVSIEHDENVGWKGHGHLSAKKLLCPIDRMSGSGDEAVSWLQKLSGSIIGDVKVTSYNPYTFDAQMISTSFDFVVDDFAEDSFGRVRISSGTPSGGILEMLPGDLRLYHEHRDSPVVFQDRMSQKVLLRIKVDSMKLVHVPEPASIENTVGIFKIEVRKEGEWLVIERELEIRKPVIQSGEWPMLRSLLLEESDASSRAILLEKQ